MKAPLKQTTLIIFQLLTVLTCMAFFPDRAHGYLYTIKADVRLRSGPGQNYQTVQTLGHNQTLIKMGENRGWVEVKTQSGQKGYVSGETVSETWIKIHKKERRLFVIQGHRTVAAFRAGLGPSDPLKDKVGQGDGATPEGRFFICESLRDPGKAKYGARSMRLSYPNIEDARRGLAAGLLNYQEYWDIVKAIRQGNMPNQNTKLGGSIRIHGGGGQKDWTLGCVALDDSEVIKVFNMVPKGARVEIYKSRRQDELLNAKDYLNKKVLAGAKKQLENPALYTREAMGAPRIGYPLGDIKPEWAVCTDIVIRSLREAGLDLQALVHEDSRFHLSRYARIKKANDQIDHRRVVNLQVYFTYNARVLPRDRLYLPGDILTIDMEIPNGTVFDHTGIVDDITDGRDNYRVINIWSVGYNTESMPLLGKDYPTTVGHFRLLHPFDYQ